ncbi:MAG TPA: polysaccharide deacetylase family protein [Bacteroidota bacterium]
MDFSARVFHLLFPSALFRAHDESVHLTFDDGPHPVATPKVLDILRKFDIRATFFLVGRQVQQLPELTRQIAAEQHRLGNHSFSHVNFVRRTKDTIRAEITRTNDIICANAGITPTLFRPPFGFYDYRTVRVVRSLGMELVHWTNDIRDYKAAGRTRRITRNIHQIGNGSIVLLHDNALTAEHINTFLPDFIQRLRDRDVSFASLR